MRSWELKGLKVDFQDTQTASYVVKTKALVFFWVLRRVKIKLELSQLLSVDYWIFRFVVFQQTSFASISFGWWILCWGGRLLYFDKTCSALFGLGGRQGETECEFQDVLCYFYIASLGFFVFVLFCFVLNTDPLWSSCREVMYSKAS